MLKANNILKKDYPNVKGLQDTLLQQNFSWDIPTSEFVQVLHVNGNHWITISNIGVSDNSVNVYDSLYNGITQTTKEIIAKYVHKEKVKINIINVQQQENDSDCGVFAIAFEKYIARRKKILPCMILLIPGTTWLSVCLRGVFLNFQKY